VAGGDFGGNVLLGYRIQHGKVTGRVKDVMVAGNVYERLARIRALGSELKWVGGGVQTPPVALDGVSVSTKG
jgi:PmbA protein